MPAQDSIFGDFAIPEDSHYKTKGEYLTAVFEFAKAAVEGNPMPIDAMVSYGIKREHVEEAQKTFSEVPRHYNAWTSI